MTRLKPFVLSALAFAALQVAAQTAPEAATSATTDDSATDNQSLSSVVISAQRRNELLQKAPLAITAVSAKEMEVKQIRRLDDMKYEVPNVVIEQNTGTSSAAKIFMRGVGTDESLFTADPSVAIYIDDMYVARQTGAMFDMFDLQRVEVLRGPQGTLYGRNATGGAIRYVTKKPTGTSRLEIDSRLGNFGRADFSLSGGGKIGEGVAVSYGILSKNRDGYLRDITNQRDVNDDSMYGARASFAFDLTAKTSARLSIDTLHQRSGPTYASGVLDPALAALYKRPVNNADGNWYTLETNLAAGANSLDQTGLSMSTTTDMGGFEWRNILTYRKMDNELYIDLDGTTQTRFHLYQDQTQNQSSYESQLVSTGQGPLSWTGGLFLLQEKNHQPTRQDIFTTGGVNTIAQTTQAAALYGQADWRFNPVWKATAGLRTSWESKDFSIDALKANGTPNFQFQKKSSWSRTDWKLGMDAQVNENLMTYASATSGFKSGGFNGRAASAAQALLVLEPETVLTYELGFKSTMAGGTVRLNGNYFRNDYKDLQLTAFNSQGASALFNAASALIQGVELEASAQINKQWQASINIGTLDAEYKDYSAANAATFGGKDLKQAPKLQVGLGTVYRTAVAGGTLSLSAQIKHVSEHYQSLNNSPVIKTDAYTLVDARAAFEKGLWSVAIWGKNLTDKRYIAGGFDIAGLGIADAYLNVPRTYGVDVRYRFW